MQITYRYRIKAKHATHLKVQAAAVNFVWNYCNEMQMKAGWCCPTRPLTAEQRSTSTAKRFASSASDRGNSARCTF